MKLFIYILLFISAICFDPRKPSKFTKKCLLKELGEQKTKDLFSSFRKYHRSNGKANFSEFIDKKKPELKETLEKCSKNKGRRLEKEKENDDIDKKLKKEMMENMISNIRDGKKIEALNKCKKLMNKEGLCERLINMNSPKRPKKTIKNLNLK